MRLAYVDDAGVSKHEPHCVVAGIVVDPDRHAGEIEDALFELARKVRPDKPNIVFHATDIWHGKGEFPQASWSFQRRMSVLRALASIPKSFSLPIIMGRCERSVLPDFWGAGKDNLEIGESAPHLAALFLCCASLEFWMRENAEFEAAMVVHEDIPRSKKWIKFVHGLARDPILGHRFGGGLCPFAKVKDTIHFANKYESRLLQIADTCAFCIRRHISGKHDIGEVFDLLRPQIANWDAVALAGSAVGRRL